MRGLPALGVVVALLAGGCSSISPPMASPLASNHIAAADDEVTTGSIGQAAPGQRPAGGLELDLLSAGRAVAEALGRGARESAVPWEDPATGARGTVTAMSSAYSQDGATCRDFLASYVRNGSESWLQGEACRGFTGRWEVRQMRPWRRT